MTVSKDKPYLLSRVAFSFLSGRVGFWNFLGGHHRHIIGKKEESLLHLPVTALLLAIAILLTLGRSPVQGQSGATPPYDVMVIFGNGGWHQYKSGEEMRRRVKWAGYLFQEKKIASRIIVTGGTYFDPEINANPPAEAAMGKLMLTDLGVDPSKILIEQDSTSTLENVLFSTAIIKANGWKKVLVVSNGNACWGNDRQAVWGSELFTDPTLEVTPNPYPLTPVADAGMSRTVKVNTAVTLLGAAFDLTTCAPVPLSSPRFQWKQIGGNPVSLSGANTSTATFTPTQPGSYRFRLLVTNGGEEGGGLYQNLGDEVTIHATQSGLPGNLSSIPKGVNAAVFSKPMLGPANSGPTLHALGDLTADLIQEGYVREVLIAGGEKDGNRGDKVVRIETTSAGMIAADIFFRVRLGLSMITRNDTDTDLGRKIAWAKSSAQSRGWTSLIVIADPADMPAITIAFSGSGITVYPIPIPASNQDTTPPSPPANLKLLQ